MNLPNLLSLLRIFMVAPFLIAVIYSRHGLALAIFVIAGFTDFLDGYLARRLEQKSVLGTFLDIEDELERKPGATWPSRIRRMTPDQEQREDRSNAANVPGNTSPNCVRQQPFTATLSPVFRSV